jgi:hypothetical protein
MEVRIFVATLARVAKSWWEKNIGEECVWVQEYVTKPTKLPN